MELQTRHDLFEPGDQTALVCMDEPETLRMIVEQLGSLDCKIHTGLFAEDVSLKLLTHVYDIVIIHERFNNADLDANQILLEATSVPAAQRRRQFLVLIGPNMATNDVMQAFLHSVDLVCSINDVANLRPVLRRGVARHKEYYEAFTQSLRAVEVV